MRKKEPLDDILTTYKPSLLNDAIDLLLANDIFTPLEFINILSEEGIPMNGNEIENLLDLPRNTLNYNENSGINKIVELKPRLYD